MNKFELPDNYVINNPNIIKLVKDVYDKQFHLLFMGVVGSGKTYLAQLIARTDKFKFIKAREAYSEYLRVRNGDYSDKHEAIRKAQSQLCGENVIFDDIGSEKPKTEAAHSFIESLMEDRYDRIKKGFPKKTIFTTNLNGEGIRDFYGDRVYDRITEVFTICRFKPKSFRESKLKVVEG
jgi:DNA replication protein DnaC